MRNLKKVLSLALALVMLVGMMVVGAGAATYADSASVNKGEAVDVMSGIGVFTGNDAGNFNPGGYLNRQEAAKIIATVTLGPTVANNLSVANTGFSDVPAGSWASGYIAYCANENIIVGADGKFRPYDLLEATEFAKMLLVAVGKDPAGYVGSGWNLNVQRDAMSANLLTNVTMGAWFDPITRENAAQMAFNAIQYSPNGSTVAYVVKASGTGAEIFRSNEFIQAYLVSTQNAGSTIDTVTTTTGSLADKVFGLSKSTSSDAFGRPTTKWTTNSGKTTVSELSSGSAIRTYTTAQTNVAADLNGYTYASGLKATVNGLEGASITAPAGIQTLTGNGKIVEVYATGTTIDKVVAINKTVAKLTAAPVVANGKVSIPELGIVNADVANVKGYETVTAGDVVLYVGNGKGVFMVEKANKITAAVTGNSASQALINGVYYSASDLTGKTYTAGSITDTKTYDLYLDNGNCIVRAEVAGTGTSQTAQLAVVQDLRWVEPTSDGSFGSVSVPYVQAKLVFMDGTSQIVTVGSIDGVRFVKADANVLASTLGTKVTAPTAQTLAAASTDANTGAAAVAADAKLTAKNYYLVGANTESAVTARYFCVGATADLTATTTNPFTKGMFYNFTESNGVYALTSLAAATQGTNTALATDKKLVGNSPIFQVDTAASGIATANTVFIYATADAQGNYTFQTYTGIANVPGTAANVVGGNSVVLNGMATHVYADLGANGTASASTDKVFITNTDFVTVNGTPSYKQGTALVNGVETTVKLASGDSYTAGVLYSVTAVDGNGIMTLNAETQKTGIKNVKDGVLTVADANPSNGNVFTYAPSALAYVLDGKTVSTTTISALALDANDKITVVTDASGAAVAAYVQKVNQAPSVVTLAAGATEDTKATVTAGDLVAGAGAATITDAKTKVKLTTITAATGTTVKSVAVNGSVLANNTDEFDLIEGSNTITIIISDDNHGPDSIFTYTVTATKTA